MFMEVIKNFFSFFWKVMVTQEVLRSGFSFSQLHTGFVVSRKLRRNLCSLKWLKCNLKHDSSFAAGNCMFKVNNRNIRTRCEICSELTIKTLERRQWHRYGVFIVNFEHISHLFLKFLLLTLSRLMPVGLTPVGSCTPNIELS